MEKVREKVLFALQEVQRAVIGKQEVTETVMKAFLAGGHVLVEDIPGLGKTTMAIAFSRAIGLQKRRVQFTPDVLPSDLTGFTIYQKERNASATCFWQMRSTGRLRRRSQPFWK